MKNIIKGCSIWLGLMVSLHVCGQDVSDFFKSHNANRIQFTKSGSFKFTILQSNKGSKPEYSICFEISDGGTRPSNPCHKNTTGTYVIPDVNAGNTLTIWTKDCSSCPAGEANLTGREWANNNHTKAKLTWAGSGGFQVVVLVEQMSQYDNLIH